MLTKKQVYIIDEECHGPIGVATSPKSAMRWLIEEGWIEEYTDFFVPYGEYTDELEQIAIRNYCDREGIDDWQQWLIDNASAEWLEDHFLIYLRQVDLADEE